MLLGFTLACALSPIDLIPDFIPVLGYLDDLILLPLLGYLCFRAVPDEVLVSARRRAEEEPPVLGKNRTAGAIILLVWLCTLFLGVLWILKRDGS